MYQNLDDIETWPSSVSARWFGSLDGGIAPQECAI